MSHVLYHADIDVDSSYSIILQPKQIFHNFKKCILNAQFFYPYFYILYNDFNCKLPEPAILELTQSHYLLILTLNKLQ